MRRSSLLLTFLVLALAGLCQPDRARLRLGPVHIQKDESIEVLVELPEGVTAGASDFQLLEDGRATVRGAELKHFKDSGWTAAVVLVVDTSGSMKKKLEQVKTALPDFVSQFKGSLALITFANEPTVAGTFDVPREQIVGRISQLRAVSKETRLYAALDKALTLLETGQPQPQRQRIILVSDGEEESQQDSSYLDGVIDRASRRRVAIDTIWTARAPYSSRDTMVRLSERTHGVHGDTQSADQIRAVLEQVTERIDGSLVVSFQRKVQAEGLTRDLGVSLNQAGVEPASMALETPIPRSAPVGNGGPAPAGKEGPTWLDILKFVWEVIKDIHSWLTAAGAVGAAYVIYTASYGAVREYRPEDISRFPFTPWPYTSKVDNGGSNGGKKTGPVGQRPARRVTIVDHGPTEKSSVLVLEGVKGPLKGERITIDKQYFSIGADPDNDLPISSDTYLSGKHAAIRASEDGWVLFDQGSTNGTFVDGKELTSESSHILQPGQVIRLGDSEFQVVSEGLGKAAPASSSSGAQTRLT